MRARGDFVWVRSTFKDDRMCRAIFRGARTNSGSRGRGGLTTAHGR